MMATFAEQPWLNRRQMASVWLKCLHGSHWAVMCHPCAVHVAYWPLSVAAPCFLPANV